ncbi:MAG: AI-2E family transporter [Hyphomicrobiaceae bacterium]
MSLVSDTALQLAARLTVIALVLIALVLGREVLIPLAIAVIIAFMLAPIVRRLELWGLHRGVAASGVVAAVVAAIAGLALLISAEMLSMTAQLDRYGENILVKVRSISSVGRDGGLFQRASKSIERIGDGISRELKTGEQGWGAPSSAATGAEKPAVVVSDEKSKGFSALIEAYLEPLTMAGLTLLFVLFLLIQFEDLRDRLVRVLGVDNLSETTSAMSEAGARLSRLFLAQGIIAASWGAIVTVVLASVGVPGALVWGILAACMRFVPFIGVLIAVLPPLVLSAGVSAEWTPVAITTIFFVLGELVIGNFVEPHFLGRQVGLTPFAMVSAAALCTLVWGPIGLLLAAPIAMALVVIGRYVPSLEIVSVLLGNEEPLTPAQAFYQRLLAKDSLGALEELEDASGSIGTSRTADEIILPALQLAARDIRFGRLQAERVTSIAQTLDDASAQWLRRNELEAPLTDNARIVVVGARGEIDAACAKTVARIIADRSGKPARAIDVLSGMSAISGLSSDRELPLEILIIVAQASVTSAQLAILAERAERDLPATRVMCLADGLVADLRPSASRHRKQKTQTVREIISLVTVATRKDDPALSGEKPVDASNETSTLGAEATAS